MGNIQQEFALLAKAMDLRVQRHAVLASNIANADTPNYKARDFDFQAAMQNAMAAQPQGGLALNQTSAAHLPGSGEASGVALKFRKDVQSAVDGNTVDMDIERAQITDNAIQYQILSQLIGDRFKGLRSAISGQV